MARLKEPLRLGEISPLQAIELQAGFESEIPDPIEFVISDSFLDRPNLYPRQATLIKIIFLRDDLFTDYDYNVIGEWEDSYRETADAKGEGTEGIVPGVLDRIQINKAAGRKWFRETVVPMGRRGSKGHIGALCGSYVLWHFIAKGDPQGFYGVDRSKRLASQVFAAKKEDAKANQWRDLKNVIADAPCFTPYVADTMADSVLIYAPYDYVRINERLRRGVLKDPRDLASFIIEPRESTPTAGRGPASFMQFYDEMAHVVKQVARAEAGVVYDAATPALDQFGMDAFLYLPSSPWQKIGKFREKYEQSIEINEDGTPAYPEMLMIQLPSWGIYKDWQYAKDLVARPSGIRGTWLMPEIKFQPLRRAMQDYDDQMRQLEKSNPETFRVERRAHFAAVLDAYLNPDRIAEMWEQWPQDAPQNKTMKSKMENLSIDYRAHGDPSKSGANFGFSIAHIAGIDDRGLPHVVFDVIHAWQPSEFEDNNYEIDYDQIERELKDYLDAFMPVAMSFDQYPMGSTIKHLREHARTRGYPKTVQVYERPATNSLNWKTYEAFKTALGLGLIHAPYFELADLELQFLQVAGQEKVDHPTAGPVQTKDVADTMAIVVYELIGDVIGAFVGKSLADLPLVGANVGGTQPFAKEQDPTHEALSNFGNFGAHRVPTGLTRTRR